MLLFHLFNRFTLKTDMVCIYLSLKSHNDPRHMLRCLVEKSLSEYFTSINHMDFRIMSYYKSSSFPVDISLSYKFNIFFYKQYCHIRIYRRLQCNQNIFTTLIKICCNYFLPFKYYNNDKILIEKSLNLQIKFTMKCNYQLPKLTRVIIKHLHNSTENFES